MNTEQLTDKLTSWIGDQVITTRCQGVVVGMSGGIDSSVLAVLCQRACPQNTLGIIMPCYSSPLDEKHALAVASKFSIPTRIVVLDAVFDALLQTLPDEEIEPATNRLAQANLKVRLRMLTLYYFANRMHHIVAGSGNRSEILIGYFTKYGDGGVDILPLGNLVKGEVKELAIYLGIPPEIIHKPASAGLWYGQTDEAELGLSYVEIDHYLQTGKASHEARSKIKSMIASGKHKHQPPPIAGLKG
ncbi:NAD(+) synthase [Chloroflexota bacterium]